MLDLEGFEPKYPLGPWRRAFSGRALDRVPSAPTINRNYGGTNFQLVSALLADMTNQVNEVLYVGDDPSDGTIPGHG
jgi:hypothetical protein